MDNKNLNFSLNKLAKFVLSHPKIIKSTSRMITYNDEPKVFTYVSEYASNDRNRSNSSSGSSFDKKRAIQKVLGEAIERYCLDAVEEKNLITASTSELRDSFVDPFTILSFSKTQLSKNSFEKFKFSKNTKFRWVEGYLYPKQIKTLIPAQLIYTNYYPLSHEPYLRFPISTGAACHNSFEEALYAGICEIIERDAFMIHYLNMIPAPIVDIDSIQNNTLSQTLYFLHRYRLELTIFDMTTDLQIPVFASLLIDRTGNGPAVSVGLKAGFDRIRGIIGAIEESLMIRTWIRDKFIYKRKSFNIAMTDIRTIDQRAYFWFKPEAIDHLKFLLRSKKTKKLNAPTTHSKNYFQKTMTLLKQANLDVYYVDIAKKPIKQAGFTVLKVFIPQLYPLYFDEKYPYLGIPRLYNVPVNLGLLQKPKSVFEFNHVPHPFL